MKVSARLCPTALVSFSLGAAALAVACDRNAPEKEPAAKATQSAAATSTDQKAKTASSASRKSEKARDALKAPGKVRTVAAKPVNKVPVSTGDPEKGDFTLEEATSGLSGEGTLQAEIVTDKGSLNCELYEDKAPITVANFVGLARGLRPWKKGEQWVKEPLYDGTKFHRIIKGFMVQGGDPAGNGSGGPGYVIPDEIWAGASHNTVGQLAMANRGPDTNGSQFFIMDGVALHLDGGYTIFGLCSPESVVRAISGSQVRGERPAEPPVIKKVNITRVPKKDPATATSTPSKR